MKVSWILILIILMGISLLSVQRGAIFYLIGALIFPSLWLGEEVSLRFELIYCLWLVFVLLIKKTVTGSTLRWHSLLSKYLMFLINVFISTVIVILSEASHVTLMQLLVSFYGVLRPLLVMFLFMNIIVDEKFMQHIVRTFIWLSVPIILLSIGQGIGVSIAQEITRLGYASPWRAPVFKLLEEQGIIIRSTGVFESPVYNAVYFLLVLVTIGFVIVRSSQRNFSNKLILYLLMALVIVAGVTTLSSTFFLGIIFVAIVLVSFLGRLYSKRLFQFALGSMFVGGLFIALLLPYFFRQSVFAGTFAYKMGQILSGGVLATRYDPTSGILSETYVAIQERPILGWGVVRANEDVFIGDSIYVSILYQGGFIGLSIFCGVIFSVLRHMWRVRNETGLLGEIGWVGFLWTLVLLVAGLSSPSFFILRLEEWYWALVGLSLNPFLRRSRLQI